MSGQAPNKVPIIGNNIPGANRKEIKIIIDMQLTGMNISVKTPFSPLETIGLIELAKKGLLRSPNEK